MGKPKLILFVGTALIIIAIWFLSTSSWYSFISKPSQPVVNLRKDLPDTIPLSEPPSKVLSNNVLPLHSDSFENSEVSHEQFLSLRKSMDQTSEISLEQESFAFDLSPSQQEQVLQDYLAIVPEARNARGLRVYVLIQQHRPTLKTHQFLNQVLEEPKCLSLENCERRAQITPLAERAQHHDSVSKVSLDYPQLMVLKGIEMNGSKWPIDIKNNWQKQLETLRSQHPEWTEAINRALNSLKKTTP